MSERTLIDCGGGVRLERGVSLTMRDGTLLVSDHYSPEGNKPLPTLLMRQPYGRDIASTVVYAHPVWYASQGFNVVIQDVRGRGDSEGDFYPFRHEAQDGFDTIELLCQRPECDGKLGMYGFSYQGMTQWLAAAEQPKGLRCIAPAQTAHDLYRGWFYQGGALRLASTMGWGLQMLKADARRLHLHEASAQLERCWQQVGAQSLQTPYGRHSATLADGLPTYVQDWFEHDVPSDYWAEMDLSRTMGRVAIPALHIAGWYDSYLSGSIQGFHAACAEAEPETRSQQYLVAGPWQHIPWGDRIGSYSFGAAANLDTDALQVRWFNHWLKDSGDFVGEPRVRHFVLQENCWSSADGLPRNIEGGAGFGETPVLTLNLHSAGRANSSRGDGVLSASLPNEASLPDVLSYDPEVPLPGPGGLFNQAGPVDQAALELGNNTLVYTSLPLKRPVRILGSPHVEVHQQSSAAHSDVVAKLICLRPGGEAIFLSIGILRGQEAPDVPHKVSFDLDATSCLFSVGDCIRLEIAASAFPLFDRNPSTAIPPRLASPWNWKRSTQTIFHDVARPSRLLLPLVEEPA